MTIAGKFMANPTAAAATELGISLPFASAIASEEDIGGTAACSAVQQSARLLGDATNDRISVQWLANDTGNRNWSFTCSARLL